MRLEQKRVLIFLYTTIGATLICTAFLHLTYTNLLPNITQFSIFILFIPPFFIGLLNNEFKDAFFAMFTSLLLSVITIVLLRSLPAFLGIITSGVTFFIISQFALSIPLFFPLILVNVLGLLAGLIINAFVLDPYTKDL